MQTETLEYHIMSQLILELCHINGIQMLTSKLTSAINHQLPPPAWKTEEVYTYPPTIDSVAILDEEYHIIVSTLHR